MKAKNLLLCILLLALVFTACSKKETIEKPTSEIMPTSEVMNTDSKTIVISAETITEAEAEKIINDVEEINTIVAGLDYDKPDSLGSVKVADLNGIRIEKPEITTPTDEQLDEYIKNYILPEYKEEASGPVADGDYVMMNLLSKENGGVYDFEYRVGSNRYTESFDKSLLNKNIGDKYDVTIQFPAAFFMHSFAGKNVIFHVEIIGIKRIPEISDKIVNTIDGSSNVEEFKKKLSYDLTQLKEKDAEEERGYEILYELIAASEYDIPKEAVDWKANMLIKGYDDTEKMSGSTFGNLVVNIWNENYNAVRNDLEQIGETTLKRALTVEAISKVQGISVTDKDLKRFYEANGIEDDSTLSEIEQFEIKNYVLEEMVANYLNNNF